MKNTTRDMKTKYVIKDWAGNRMFPSKEFKTFEAGRDYITENVPNEKFDQTQNPNDDNHQEYYVIVID